MLLPPMACSPERKPLVTTPGLTSAEGSAGRPGIGPVKSPPVRPEVLPVVPPEPRTEPSEFSEKGLINQSKPSSSRLVCSVRIMVTLTATTTGSVWLTVSTIWEMKSRLVAVLTTRRLLVVGL